MPPPPPRPPGWPKNRPTPGMPPLPPGWAGGRPTRGIPPPPPNIINVHPSNVKKKKSFTRSGTFANFLGGSTKRSYKKTGQPVGPESSASSDYEIEAAGPAAFNIGSGIRSGKEDNRRADAVEKGLVLVVRRQLAAVPPSMAILPARTFTTQDKNPSDKRVFSSARIYQEKLSTGQVSLELTSWALADEENPIGANPGSMWWL